MTRPEPDTDREAALAVAAAHGFPADWVTGNGSPLGSRSIHYLTAFADALREKENSDE
jgi:hypothetical protein